MNTFISYNKADVTTARLLGTLLIENGHGAWFDEWELEPGDSIIGGIEAGLAKADYFILIWSKSSAASRWVGTELRSFLTKQIKNPALKIIPIMIDETPLPMLIADFLGFQLQNLSDLNAIVEKIVGKRSSRHIAKLLQRRLLELAAKETPNNWPIRLLVCPKCASDDLVHEEWQDLYNGPALFVMCNNCDWGSAGSLKPKNEIFE